MSLPSFWLCSLGVACAALGFSCGPSHRSTTSERHAAGGNDDAARGNDTSNGGSPSSNAAGAASARAGAAGHAGIPESGAGGISLIAGADAGGGGPEGGASEPTNCSSQTRSSRAGRSAGFSGSYQQFTTIYSASCGVAADCVATCVTAGGTSASCATSECIESSTKYCLPPTFWFDPELLLVEASSIESSAWITLVNNPYRDPLVVTNFQFELPAGAKVQGITFSFNRAADTPNLVADYSLRAVQGGLPVGLDRASAEAWSTDFGYHDYGGPNDRWGSSWTPDAVNSPEFGVVLTPLYLDTGGNAHAYVDFVRATVDYCL